VGMARVRWRRSLAALGMTEGLVCIFCSDLRYAERFVARFRGFFRLITPGSSRGCRYTYC
jgi:hypothetical protein